jgi:hypothetical protein
MDEPVHLKSAGATWWHTEDYSSPNLSKSSLGEFFYRTLAVGAHIGFIWPFNHRVDRSGVYISVFMTEDMKKEIESKTKFKFRVLEKIMVS